MSSSPFENWGKTFSFRPKELLYPRSVEEVSEIVKKARKAGKKIRVVGTAHSWNPLIVSDDILISLDNWSGLENVDREKCQATVRAGTKLHIMCELLRQEGMAMENQGDIDRQAIAGAISTGTHGTGMNFGVLATQAVEITVVNGEGDVITLRPDTHPEAFKGAQVALGMLGVIVKLRLQLIPAYNLECVKKREDFETCLNNIDEHRFNTRNFELYWFPFSDLVATKYLNMTTEQPPASGLKKYLTDVVYENGTFKVLSEACRVFPSLTEPVSKLAANAIAAGREVHHSHRVYATPRLVRFYEMEYGVPDTEGPTVLRKIKAHIAQQKYKVHFPLEYRYVKGDDIWLSPAHGGATCFISVHMYLNMPYQEYFAGLEKIFLDHGGRPHWGKLHTLQAAQLRPKYPKWDNFMELRAQMDPDRVFVNPYIAKTFGV